jgi:ankyrin repeat protein
MQNSEILLFPLDCLPNVLIKYLSSFLDLDSLLRFSSVNQKCRNIFLQIRKGLKYFKEMSFVFFNGAKNLNKNDLQDILVNKKFSSLKDVLGNGPLHIAALNSSLEMIKYFFENKCEINLRNNSGETALHQLCKNNYQIPIESIEFLVENKCAINSRTTNNTTPFHFACKNKHFNVEILNFFVDNFSNLNSSNNYKETPFHYACMNENISFPLLKLLADKKCDINMKDYLNISPLHFISENKNVNVEMIKFLGFIYFNLIFFFVLF